MICERLHDDCDPRDCHGTWPYRPGETPRPFHVRGCPNNPAVTPERLHDLAARTPPLLTVEVDDGQVWAVCSCGWTRAFGQAVAWGEMGWQVSQHADTHRRQP